MQRTLRACREQGRFVEKLEQWLSYGNRKKHAAGFGKDELPMGTRRDAFGFIDIMAIDTDAIVAIQACTQSGKKHKEAILANEYALAWLKAGFLAYIAVSHTRIELWIWRKVKEVRGGKRERWSAKIENITIADFD